MCNSSAVPVWMVVAPWMTQKHLIREQAIEANCYFPLQNINKWNKIAVGPSVYLKNDNRKQVVVTKELQKQLLEGDHSDIYNACGNLLM